uniref:Binding-protein-dependent transport systems inner membrane component n=1 Tax=uncultured Chloroflexota bacterium TaxID=166587 RepID=H5SM20_9CHLR|nr:binding-protein-dependent transport systems inner membrane component [uncultured Chloroflexota bacterium]BAL57206.1 binding-protein-dependent transport systems inner membrane component [uncultured Chloroflexota bacterium]
MPRGNASGFALALLMVAGSFGLWEAAVSFWNIPVYLLPAPSRIAQTFFAQPTYFLEALFVTIGEAAAGLMLGTLVGVLVALLVILQPGVERGVMTLAILVKSTPLAAIAPLLTIWLGFGMLPKVIITALLVFFPMLVNVLVGMQSAGREMLDLLRVLQASEWQVLVHLRFWLSLPYLFAALRVVTPLSLVGAVIAEWTGASNGLGRVMWLAYSNLNLPPMFAAIFILSLFGMFAYGLIVWLEKRVIHWV